MRYLISNTTLCAMSLSPAIRVHSDQMNFRSAESLHKKIELAGYRAAGAKEGVLFDMYSWEGVP